MNSTEINSNEGSVILPASDFDCLFTALKKAGYSIIGPRVRDHAIVYDHIEKTGDLPIGWGDSQEKGTYRLKKRKDKAFFGYVVGAHSWKKYLHKPKLKLWSAQKKDGRVTIENTEHNPERLAFLGVRGCDLQARHVQDRIFLEGQYQDPHYADTRNETFIIAVNCTTPADTCFCTSMNTGPKAGSGYDLALTELLDNDRHEFLIETGSERAKAILKVLPTKTAEQSDLKSAQEVIDTATKKIERSLETDGLKELLQNNLEHSIWDEIAERCLSCANCTMVCPTCFCTTVEDVTDLTGNHAERWRYWDSCFTSEFSYIHNASTRQSVKSRYRQWMTHKLASWHDQFNMSGCTGCGRCITWCPVGIDITEEAKALRKSIETEEIT